MTNKRINSAFLFFKSSSFYKGLVLTISIIIPVILLYSFDKIEYAVPIAIGVLLNSASNISGSYKRKVNSMLISIVFTMLITLIIIVLKPYFVLLFATIVTLTFLISLISVYGFRGSLLAFSGLFAIVLGLAYDADKGVSISDHVLLVGLGGVWYLIVTIVFSKLSPNKDVDELLMEVMNLTGDYLKLRSKRLTDKLSRIEVQNQSLKLQTEISEKHEVLREILLTSRRKSGRSHFDEKRLLIFISLEDIFELSLANSVDLDKFDNIFADYKDTLDCFANLNVVIGNHLKTLSGIINKKSRLPSNKELLQALEEADLAIEDYVNEVKLPKARDGAILLRNLLNYQEKQINEIRGIRRVVANVKNASKLTLKRQEAHLFITHQEYSFSIILENLNLESPILRHSLRITIAIAIAFLVGRFLDVENAYWIILTIIVIMRPSYGLTKERSINRLVGTVIGAVVASLIILATQNTVVYAIFAIGSLTFGFSLVQQNYKMAAAFITIHVIFVFALLEPSGFDVVKLRILDTFIGAGIAIAANYILFPNWEHRNIKSNMVDVVRNNMNYLNATKQLYETRIATQLEYKVPRKEALLAVSNLNASFARMTQDPKSKQVEYEQVYEIVTLSNTILSATASMGTFIQNKDSTYYSDEFNPMVDQIVKILQRSLLVLEENIDEELEKELNHPELEENIINYYNRLVELRDKEIAQGEKIIKKETLANLQEAHLLSNQLVWLKNLSENLYESVVRYSN